MRVSRIFMAAGLAAVAAAGSMAILSAQARTDGDYAKLMKGVGVANAAMRKAPDAAGTAAEAAKLVAFFKDAQQFWIARKNKEAADWAASAMTHAAEVETAAKAGNAEAAASHQRELGGMCMTCHAKYREKTEKGFAIKKG
jgi:hypothetical protein